MGLLRQSVNPLRSSSAHTSCMTGQPLLCLGLSLLSAAISLRPITSRYQPFVHLLSVEFNYNKILKYLNSAVWPFFVFSQKEIMGGLTELQLIRLLRLVLYGMHCNINGCFKEEEYNKQYGAGC